MRNMSEAEWVAAQGAGVNEQRIKQSLRELESNERASKTHPQDSEIQRQVAGLESIEDMPSEEQSPEIAA